MRKILHYKGPQFHDPITQHLLFLENQRKISGQIRDLEFLCLSINNEIPPLQIVDQFQALDPEIKGTLCRRIWELEDSPIGNSEYGLQTIVESPHLLASHPKTNLLKEYIDLLESRLQIPFTPILELVEREEIQETDQEETIENILHLHALQDLQNLLPNRRISIELLQEKFEALDQNTQDTLISVVAICHKLPRSTLMDRAERKKEVLNNPRLLLEIANDKGEGILSQLISHCQTEITLRREIDRRIGIFTEAAGYVKKESNVQKNESTRKSELDEILSPLGKGFKKIFALPDKLHELTSKQPQLLQETLKRLKKERSQIGEKKRAELAEGIRALDQRMNPYHWGPQFTVSANHLNPENLSLLPEELRIAMVSAEFGPIAAGGLGPAVHGLAEALSQNNVVNVRVIVPPLPSLRRTYAKKLVVKKN